MRTIEIVLVASTVAAVVVPAFWGSRVVVLASAAAAVIAAIVQAVVEGSRWQLYGIYALLIVLLAVRWTRRNLADRQWTARAPLAGGLVVVVLSAVLLWALPVPVLPAPSGLLAVGTTSWMVTDGDRLEVYDDFGLPRQFVAQAWYPTDAVGDGSSWISDPAAFSRELAPAVGLPGFALRHLDQAQTSALVDVPVSPGPWPVVVYSHGWGGFRTIQSDYAEYLASQGFVVLAMDHTYGAGVTLFPEDPEGETRAVPLNTDALPDEDVVGETAYKTAIQLLELTFAEDVAEALDQLAAGFGPALLAGQLQLDQVGLSGHSTGGGAMVRLCLTDDRCAGVLGFDPWLEPVPADLLARGLNSPVVSIRSEDWLSRPNDELVVKLHADSNGDEGRFFIEGTVHADFTLQPFLTPLAGITGSSGPADDLAVHDAVNRTALNFFDRHLRTGSAQVAPPAIIRPG